MRIVLRLGSRPMIERDRIVLPEPLSPTMPSVLPRSSVKLTPSTARTTPRGVWNVGAEVARPRRQRAGPSGRLGALGASRSRHRPPSRMSKRLAQHVADEVEGQHGEEHHRRGHQRDPPGVRPGSCGRRRSSCPTSGRAAATLRPRKASAPSATMSMARPVRANVTMPARRWAGSRGTCTRRVLAPRLRGGQDELALRSTTIVLARTMRVSGAIDRIAEGDDDVLGAAAPERARWPGPGSAPGRRA